MAQALQSFAKMVTLKRQTFSHKQMKFLNDPFRSRDWRMSWNRYEYWVRPLGRTNEIHPFWPPLFAPLPKKGSARCKAIGERKEALKSLAAQFNKVVLHCGQLPDRKMAYIEEPKANKLIRQIFEVVQEHPVMDKIAERRPRAQGP